jgi:hypothetical protein
MRKILIRNLAVEPDGALQIDWYDPATDVKANGAIQIHTLVVPAGQDYDQEISDVMDTIKYCVLDVLDDWDKLDAMTPATDGPDGIEGKNG